MIVLTHNSAGDIGELLGTLEQQTRAPEQVLVVDNASSDATVDVVRSHQGVELVELPTNVGFARGSNLAASMARGSVLVFVNADMILDERWHEMLVGKLETEPSLAAVQSLVLLADQPQLINTAGHEFNYLGAAWCGHYREPRNHAEAGEISAMSGASFAIRREAFDSLGGFSEDFFMYHEDLDLSWRLRLAGHRFALALNSVCYHKYDFRKPSVDKVYLAERNRIISVLQNYSTRSLLLIAPMLVLFEVGACAQAGLSGTLTGKLRGYRDIIKQRKSIWRRRAQVQGTRVVTDAQMKRWLTGRLAFEEMQSPLIVVGSRLSQLYWRAVERFIR